MEGSIMDSLGVEIIGVMSPVSICMLLVVLIVSFLSPPPSAAVAPPVTAATLVYLESPSDSPAQKLEGALLNAAVFVALVAAVTFLLVVLYYYNFTGFLKNYMRFSAFFIIVLTLVNIRRPTFFFSGSFSLSGSLPESFGTEGPPCAGAPGPPAGTVL